MRDHEFRRRPPKAPLWQRLKYQLELWAAVPPENWGALRSTGTIGAILLLALIVVLVVLVLPIVLLVWGFGLVVDFFIGSFHLQSLTNPIYEIAIGLFAMLGWLWILLWTRRKRGGTDSNPPRRGLALPFSEGGNLFWGGMAFCAIGTAQIALSTFAFWLSILFWVTVACVVFPSVPRIIFTPVLRRLRRPAHWQY